MLQPKCLAPRVLATTVIARCILLVCLVMLCGWPTLVLGGVPVLPQPRQLTVADGLPSNMVYGLDEDENGYLWLASSDGLARYDGRNYRIWRIEEGLRDNQVWAVHVDKRNRVWIGTGMAGLAMLDTARHTFTFYDGARYPQLRGAAIWNITSTEDGSIWFGTEINGLYRLRPDGSLDHFTHRADDPHSLPNDAIYRLDVDAEDTLWVGTADGAAHWTGKDFERQVFPDGTAQIITRLTADHDGSVWIGTSDDKLFRRDPNGRLSPHSWNTSAQYPVLGVLLRDHDGSYWLDTLAGLGHAIGKDVQNVPLYSLSAHGRIRPNWESAYQDREGGVWFASPNGGLWHLPSNWRRFAVVFNLIDDGGQGGNLATQAAAKSRDGRLWLVGTSGVLERVDPGIGKIERVRSTLGTASWANSVLEDRKGRVWIGQYAELLRFDPANGQLLSWNDGASRSSSAHQDAALDASQDSLQQTGDRHIWINTAVGLQERDEEGHVIRAVLRGSHGLDRDQVVHELQTGPEGNLWLATNRGVLQWNADSARFEPIPGAPNEQIFTLRFSDSQVAWFAGLGKLHRYLWKNGVLQHLDTVGAEQEFPALAPNGLVIDRDGVAWLSSMRGLIRVDPATRGVRVYGVHDGLPDPQFVPRSLVQSAKGLIVGATPDGLVIFDPAELKPNDRRVPLVIEQVGLRRGERGLDLSHVEPLVVEDGDRDLHFVARLLSFADSESNGYRFRLSGYDPDWIDVGPSGERLFSRLPAGRYTLEVQGRTGDGIWSATQTLRFQVLPPWWLAPWGLVLLGLLALCVIAAAVLLYRRRLRRLNAWQLAVHKQELAKQASLAKTRFLATLGHEVRTPMTGVLGMSELLLKTSLDNKQRSYTESIRRAGAHLLRLVNDALDLARIESGRLELDLEPFSVRQLMAEVEALMAPLARERGLRFSLEVGLLGDITASGDSTRIRQILLNLLSNAIKFTERGVVGLKLTTLGSYQGLRFEVADTGPGINAEQKARLFQRFEQGDGAKTTSRYGGSGLGLAICQELAMAMDGHIEVISRLGAGTRFVVDLPLRWVASNATFGGEVARAGAAVAPQRILLVEDDPTIAEVILGLLRSQGHSVVHAPHGLAALTEAADNIFDLALLDLDLPGLDGFALARQLRVFGYDMPLIAVTARSDEAAEPTAQEAGFDSFLRKPLTGDMLADTIADTLRRARPREDG
ncbi:two-component regulator propeller domain-containing protein [Xanthomonas fragariae]|uniref:hybrid sensor histidine kinase/response regulator n=1 Tax=Xanthomonas fragariae TaxID=48664 RepID=UPI002B20C239|nr:two-component regulator propeller domain-containing protein [Xanthomonas fragariae]MEA5175214.1 two-component regulator propeller domain-containing protein [Xanthomonas fragariae]